MACFSSMIGLVFVLGLSSAHAYPTSCEGVGENQTVLLPNPKNCSSYIECVMEEPVVMPCPVDLQWNDKIKECDFPELANCKETPSRNEKELNGEENLCEGVGEDEIKLLPTPGNCSTYILCTYETPVILICPEGLQWNDEAKYCDYPENANCKESFQRANNPCAGVSPIVDVLLPNPKDCGSYIQCVHGQPMVRPCPSGLHWSTAAKRCEWPNVANCKRNACEGVPESIDVLLPNPEDCGTYIQCVHQQSVVRNCPGGLHWSVDSNRCDWPNLAHCNSTIPA